MPDFPLGIDPTNGDIALVNISKSALLPELPLPSFTVLFDPTLEDVNELASLMPDHFIFVFSTVPAMEVPDFTGLVESDYVSRPIYIGNFEPISRAQIVATFVSDFLSVGLESGDH
jgi:hypothetical protein